MLIDYASPKKFKKSNTARGVGLHPHRGFETVTFAYRGEIKHQDSLGEGGIIKAGDVQWMTAGSGIIHSEFHSENFLSSGMSDIKIPFMAFFKSYEAVKTSFALLKCVTALTIA